MNGHSCSAVSLDKIVKKIHWEKNNCWMGINTYALEFWGFPLGSSLCDFVSSCIYTYLRAWYAVSIKCMKWWYLFSFRVVFRTNTLVMQSQIIELNTPQRNRTNIAFFFHFWTEQISGLFAINTLQIFWLPNVIYTITSLNTLSFRLPELRKVMHVEAINVFCWFTEFYYVNVLHLTLFRPIQESKNM
jgi:hypothetical protein